MAAIPRFHDGPAALPADRVATPLPLALRPGYGARVRDEETVVSLVFAALLVVILATLALDGCGPTSAAVPPPGSAVKVSGYGVTAETRGAWVPDPDHVETDTRTYTGDRWHVEYHFACPAAASAAASAALPWPVASSVVPASSARPRGAGAPR